MFDTLDMCFGSDVIINYCNPLIAIGQTLILDRPAEFFDYDLSVFYSLQKDDLKSEKED
jgi:hypothetical protein